MVKVPVAYTLATAEPEMEPNRPLARMDALAGPPRRPEVQWVAKSMKNLPTPLASRKQPNTMKRNT